LESCVSPTAVFQDITNAKEGKKERRKEGKKERRKEGKKERKKEENVRRTPHNDFLPIRSLGAACPYF
jgi:hypothetical protein